MKAALIPTWLQEYEKEAGYMTKQAVATAMYKLIMDNKYTAVEFHKETYPEFLTKIRDMLSGDISLEEDFGEALK